MTAVASMRSSGSAGGRRAVFFLALVAAIVAVRPLTAAAWQQPRQPRTRLEVRLAETEPATGLTEAAVSGSAGKIYLHQEVVVSERDIVRARVVESSGGPTFDVMIMLNPQSVDRLIEATDRHVGKPLAILINGVVLAAPVVEGATAGDIAVLSADFTKEEADKLAADFNDR